MTLKGLTLIGVEYLRCDHDEEGFIRLIYEDENKDLHIKTELICSSCRRYLAH